MKIDKKYFLKRGIPILLGGIGGYLYYYYIGCYNGSCPITGSPYISTLYGGAIGLILGMSNKTKKTEDANDR
ncbi:MAG: DUF6132 family protein [Melioribacteraceae bacterium]|nr:DUF6132 family protein [Melioribacteraceae bacterium]MCF8414056.1 DUF6132 family protein [Melioribacteraceae bacterium]